MIQKYTPKHSKEIIGNQEQIQKFRDWLADQNRRNKACLLHGVPGIGKTLTVYLVGQEMGYEIIEYNSSDIRTKVMLDKMEHLMRTPGLGGLKLLFLFDEMDGMYAWATLERLALQSIHPVVFTANEDFRIAKKLLNKCKRIKFYPPRQQDIINYIKKIADSEGKQITFDNITGDVRQSIISVLGDGDTYVTDTIFDEVRSVFHGAPPEKYDRNLGIWLLDNAHRFLSGKKLYDFFDTLALADRIGRTDPLVGIKKNLSGRVEYPYFYRRMKVLGGTKK